MSRGLALALKAARPSAALILYLFSRVDRLGPGGWRVAAHRNGSRRRRCSMS